MAALVLTLLPLASILFIAARMAPAVPATEWTGTPADILVFIALLSIASWPATVVWTILFAVLGIWSLWRR